MFSVETWQVLDHWSIILGYILWVPIIFSAWELLQERKKRVKYKKEIIEKPGSRPTVLIVDIRKPDTASIRPQVEQYLRTNFREIALSSGITFVAEFKGEMDNADLDSIMSTVRKQVGKCVEYGTDRIHLFIRGPLPVALSVGEYLSNFAAPVLFHHNQPNKGYENWGPIHR